MSALSYLSLRAKLIVKVLPVSFSLMGTFLVFGGATLDFLLLPVEPSGTSSECCATVEDVPESSTDKSKRPRAEPPQTKKVSAREDGTGGAFTIDSTLDSK